MVMNIILAHYSENKFKRQQICYEIDILVKLVHNRVNISGPSINIPNGNFVRTSPASFSMVNLNGFQAIT